MEDFQLWGSDLREGALVNISIRDLDRLTITENSDGFIHFNYSTTYDACLKFEPRNPTMLDINGNYSIPLFPSKHVVVDSVPIRSFWTGYSELAFSILDGYCDELPSGNNRHEPKFYHLHPDNQTFSMSRSVMILPYDGIAQRLFFYMTFAMVLINMLVIGLENHPKIWRKDWKKFRYRILPVIVRYLTNPVLALGLSFLFRLSHNDLVTVLVMSVLPGCGFSRLMSYLYGGNKNLSYSQGFYSILASSIAVPVILLLVDLSFASFPFLDQEKDPLNGIKLEFIMGFFWFCSPILPGVFLRYLAHKYKMFPSILGPRMGDLLKPLTLSLSLCVLAFGLYTHMFVFFKFSLGQLGWVFLYPILSMLVSIGFSCLFMPPSDELLSSICEWWMQNIAVGLAVTHLSSETLHTLHAAIALKIFIPYALWVFALNILFYTAFVSTRRVYREHHNKKLPKEGEESDATLMKRASFSLTKRQSIMHHETSEGDSKPRPAGARKFSEAANTRRESAKKEELLVMPDLSLIPKSAQNSGESSSDLSDSSEEEKKKHSKVIDLPDLHRRPSYVTFGLRHAEKSNDFD